MENKILTELPSNKKERGESLCVVENQFFIKRNFLKNKLEGMVEK